MLTPAQILPFINHSNPNVRLRALDYVRELDDAAPRETADEIWKAIDQFGDQVGMFKTKDINSFVRVLRAVPHTDASDARAMDLLRQTKPESDTGYFLQEFFRDLPLHTVDQHREEIFSLVHPDTKASLLRRLELRSLTSEQLWDRFLQHGIKTETIKKSSKVDWTLAAELVEALSEHPGLAAPRAMQVLQDHQDKYYLETWCIQLLGRLRHSATIDAVIDKMQNDQGDFMHPVAGTALSRMEAHQTVAKLLAWCDQNISVGPEDVADEHNEALYRRTRIHDTLGKIKHPPAETAMLQLLARETHPTGISSACVALVDLCTTEGLEQLRQVVIEDKYDATLADIREEIVTLAEMTGFAPPELETWKAELTDKEYQRKRRAEWLGKMGMTEERVDLLRKLTAGKSPAEIAEMLTDPPKKKPPKLSYTQSPVVPLRRSTPKIGRNDPCTCGSGKKYKKCCGG